MSHDTCAAMSPQELAHHLRELLRTEDFPFDVDHFVGTSQKRYNPRLLDGSKIPGVQCGYIPDTRNASASTVCDMDYFIGYVAAHPDYRTLVKYGGINTDVLLVLGTREILDIHGEPFYPLAWYTREKGHRPPTLHALRDIGKLAPDAPCLLLYRDP